MKHSVKMMPASLFESRLQLPGASQEEPQPAPAADAGVCAPAKAPEPEASDGLCAFCTISGCACVVKTIALYDSIAGHLKDFRFFICCTDALTYNILSDYLPENTTLLGASEVQTAAERHMRGSSTPEGYLRMLKPALCSHVLARYGTDRLLYCDPDICFFSHPQAVFDTWGESGTLLSRRLCTPELETRYGKYHAGMIGFTKTPESQNVLDWWLAQCAKRRSDQHGYPSGWADQRDLDQIPERFASVESNGRPGMVAGPWSILMKRTSGIPVRHIGNDVYIGDEKLVCYHFSGLHLLGEYAADLFDPEPFFFSRNVITHIYLPYLSRLGGILRAISARGFGISLLLSDAANARNPFSAGQGAGGVYEHDYAYV